LRGWGSVHIKHIFLLTFRRSNTTSPAKPDHDNMVSRRQPTHLIIQQSMNITCNSIRRCCRSCRKYGIWQWPNNSIAFIKPGRHGIAIVPYGRTTVVLFPSSSSVVSMSRRSSRNESREIFGTFARLYVE
jgi:hypothetical protein